MHIFRSGPTGVELAGELHGKRRVAELGCLTLVFLMNHP
jgi:NADH dehydrogenase FAD-containing subunit